MKRTLQYQNLAYQPHAITSFPILIKLKVRSYLFNEIDYIIYVLPVAIYQFFLFF